MVLVDTSVWVSHLRDGNVGLEKLLNDGEVVRHPFIVGELACGNLKNRDKILSYLQSLPVAILAEDEEVLKFVENNQLMGKGLGYIDVHLIASAVLTDVALWTFDKTLDTFTKKIGISY
ncbi:MAG: type II toxin-antitoxin system VapC family toxin [Deltaproteobacteria bacterium]|nr:type II toxin-antitoxin system VapC family toxin [Deltaproteobacteria bacterium]